MELFADATESGREPPAVDVAPITTPLAPASAVSELAENPEATEVEPPNIILVGVAEAVRVPLKPTSRRAKSKLFKVVLCDEQFWED